MASTLVDISTQTDFRRTYPIKEGTGGLVIGAGGRTIREIHRITGCDCRVVSGPAVDIEGCDEASVSKAAWIVDGISLQHICYEDLSMLPSKNFALPTLTVASPLCQNYYVSVQKEVVPGVQGRAWSSWCPCCRRPVDITLNVSDTCESQPGETLPFRVKFWRAPKFAYVAALWGDQPGFVLGALVLGHALQRTSAAGHDRVLLHTSLVPKGVLQKLQSVWRLRQVSYVDACERCFLGGKTGRFEGVFTKLHALGLTEYTKVLVLDLDLAVRKCLDHLFELDAPAALARGPNDRQHGDRIDGRNFFVGEAGQESGDETDWSWCQGGGINAGVMLLEPNETIYRRALQEIKQPYHPAHIPGAGPEQDYLSRLYAPFWRHISVKYNFQIHHVFYNLEAVLQWWQGGEQDEAYLPARFKLSLEDVAVVHFSGTLKMWDRDYQFSNESDEAFAARVLRNCNSCGCQRWIDRRSSDEDYLKHKVRLLERDGAREFFVMKADACSEVSVEHLVNRGVDLANKISLCATEQWREDLYSLLQHHPELGTLSELMRDLGKACSPEGSGFYTFQPVNFKWNQTEEWYPAIVAKASSSGQVELRCTMDGWHGTTIFAYPENIRERTTDPEPP
eukprot:TRINITY_DN28539_c0_g1_i1.p1 TRINITY_DN28539_c0_g1~~TRINITY_DN28539_c0_g1_i1.p1  ORF type:complete len:631 (-),score=52.82 TRINITY_DN28539_c0_g1_i1:111-1973(-)